MRAGYRWDDGRYIAPDGRIVARIDYQTIGPNTEWFYKRRTLGGLWKSSRYIDKASCIAAVEKECI